MDIFYEPNPAYTNEARVLKMEGDVMLEVVFLASGQLQVTRVVSGLGHGLDEASIQAANRYASGQQNKMGMRSILQRVCGLSFVYPSKLP